MCKNKSTKHNVLAPSFITTFLRLRNKLRDAYYKFSITTEALNKHLSIYRISLHVQGQGCKEVQSGMYNVQCSLEIENFLAGQVTFEV